MSTFDQMANEFLAQKRIAVAGMSRNGTATGNAIYKALRDRGYEVVAVHPEAETLEGDPCYPTVQTIPGGVDGLFIVTRPALALQLVRDAAQAGVQRVWMHENGFFISGGSVAQEAVDYCNEHGIQVIAGGCPMMFLDFAHKCMKWMLGVSGRLPA